jgi:hypothetical protein
LFPHSVPKFPFELEIHIEWNEIFHTGRHPFPFSNEARLATVVAIVERDSHRTKAPGRIIP